MMLLDDDFQDLAVDTIPVPVMHTDKDGEWEEIEEQEGSEILASQYPPRPKSPLMVRGVYGAPNVPTSEAGIVELPAPIGSQTVIRVHRKVVILFQDFLDAIEEAGMWGLVQSIRGQKTQMWKNATYRGGDRRVSPTSWGIAVTINPQYNLDTAFRNAPWGFPVELVRDGQPGYSFYEGHPIVQIARRFNLVWGGSRTWDNGAENRRPDPSVFFYCAEWSTK